MTVHYAPKPAPPARAYRFRFFRALFCGVLLACLLAVCLYLHHAAFTPLVTLLKENGKVSSSKILNLFSYWLPFIVICTFHYAVYHRYDRRDGIVQREMFVEILVSALLVYAVLYPVVAHISDQLQAAVMAIAGTNPPRIPLNDGRVYQTLKMDLHEWFVRLSIPFALLSVYHHVRARRETAEALSEGQKETAGTETAPVSKQAGFVPKGL